VTSDDSTKLSSHAHAQPHPQPPHPTPTPPTPPTTTLLPRAFPLRYFMTRTRSI
jgi:hypothetical protein